MKALMLAAGVGNRLFGDNRTQPPKALLRFDGKTLLQRHIAVLRAHGIDQLSLVVGYRKNEVIAEAMAHAGPSFVRKIENPMYRGGPIISLWTAREALNSGDDILFMDADVLYHPEIIRRLIDSPHQNCFVFDRDIEEGEDPVRLCIRGGVPVDFGKRVVGDFDMVGEWPGFLKMSSKTARLLAQAAENYIESGLLTATYEEAMRDVLVGEPVGTFGYEDITGLPWIEIDYPTDLDRATSDVLPRIAAAEEGVSESERRDSTVVRPKAFNR